MRFKDLTGQRFGKLRAIRRAEPRGPRGTNKRRISWLCRCDCGKWHIALSTHLVRGRTRSCGCLWRRLMLDCRDAAGRLISPWNA